MKLEDLTPAQRGALIASLLLDAIALLPTSSCGLHLTAEELNDREARGQAYLEQISDLRARRGSGRAAPSAE